MYSGNDANCGRFCHMCYYKLLHYNYSAAVSFIMTNSVNLWKNLNSAIKKDSIAPLLVLHIHAMVWNINGCKCTAKKQFKLKQF